MQQPTPENPIAGDEIRPAAQVKRRGGIIIGTLAIVRWAAVIGQLAAVLAVSLWLEFPMPVAACVLAIAALAVTNIWLTATRPWRSRLTGYHAARILVFDLLQLTTLAYLTGGLANPFVFLIVVPVTVTATTLSREATLMVGILALFCITFLAFFQMPLPWDGPPPALPLIYVAGHWIALAVAIVFMSAYIWSVAEGARRQDLALAETEASLGREQRMSALGGLAAAAAHELGSPLNTIGLIAKDIQTEIYRLEGANTILKEDVDMLVEQATRCRDILKALSEKPDPGTENPFGDGPLTAIAEEAAQGHIPDRIEFRLAVDEASIGSEPNVSRSPELLHGVGNLVSNAGQFATSTVSVSLYWDDDLVRVTVADDGPGFPGWMLDSLGEPYLSTRSGKDGHMGLGIFIATTLLDRIGAQVTYKNQKSSGASVMLLWSREVIEATYAAQDWKL